MPAPKRTYPNVTQKPAAAAESISAAAAPAPKPRVRFEPTTIPQGDGKFLVVAGKPIVETSEPEISMPEFLRRVKARGGRLSERYAQQLCDEGRIRARKLVADKEKSQWRIVAAEVDRFVPRQS